MSAAVMNDELKERPQFFFNSSFITAALITSSLGNKDELAELRAVLYQLVRAAGFL